MLLLHLLCAALPTAALAIVLLYAILLLRASKLNPTTSPASSRGLCFFNPCWGAVCYSFPVRSRQTFITFIRE